MYLTILQGVSTKKNAILDSKYIEIYFIVLHFVKNLEILQNHYDQKRIISSLIHDDVFGVTSQ